MKNLYNITRKHLMDSNLCATSCIMKELGRKKTLTKGVHKNISQGYNKINCHIMKNLHLCCYVSIHTKFGQDPI